MSILTVQSQDNQLVVDSRLIAATLEVRHKNFLATIRKYQNETEKEFGYLAFKKEPGSHAGSDHFGGGDKMVRS